MRGVVEACNCDDDGRVGWGVVVLDVGETLFVRADAGCYLSAELMCWLALVFILVLVQIWEG